MKKLFILTWMMSLLVAVPGFCADYTTTKAVLMDWTKLDDMTSATPYLETNPLVTDTWIGCILYVDVAHIDTDVGTATPKVKIWAKSGTTDEYWHKIQELSITITAANEGNVTASAADNCTLNMASTTNFEASGDVYFIEDAGTLADSCLVVNADFENDQYVTTIDNRVNAYDAADSAWDIVDQWPVRLGPGFTYKVTFHNTDADANYACRVHYRAETAIE